MGFIVKRQDDETQADFEIKVERFHNLTKLNLLNFTEPFTNVTLPTQDQSVVVSIPKVSLTGEHVKKENYAR